MSHRSSTLFLMAIICVSVVGYFVGLHRGIPDRADKKSRRLPADTVASDQPLTNSNGASNKQPNALSAITYSEIPQKLVSPTDLYRASLHPLPNIAQQTRYDSFAEIKLNEADKERSSQQRKARRAYNGAPPVVPHAIENTTDAACFACHSSGMRMTGLKASVMSHRFLANCLQCHAPPAAAPFQEIGSEVESNFAGLPAPHAGERAYPGAPPTIPHSQWMRENCLACHGGPNGWAGMESTHPWRTQCTQCHAPSAVLDQATSTSTVQFLPPLEAVNR